MPAPRIYRALLSQNGSNAPTASVFENTLDGDVVWNRLAGGTFNGTLAGAFAEGKTLVFATLGESSGDAITLTANRLTSDKVVLITKDSEATSVDPSAEISIEIIVYP
jgi:hypothetical protein